MRNGGGQVRGGEPLRLRSGVASPYPDGMSTSHGRTTQPGADVGPDRPVSRPRRPVDDRPPEPADASMAEAVARAVAQVARKEFVFQEEVDAVYSRCLPV